MTFVMLGLVPLPPVDRQQILGTNADAVRLKNLNRAHDIDSTRFQQGFNVIFDSSA
ncbi:hypothetical protein CUJ84_Chr003264 [Rhizobium leguminosarum]|uniref:Uncharacterized protein n=1 Tax=Rhizobium leguminosarum TaxID=384 RepID=A0A2K9Z5U6_RHILE|nr:hypothetical protein CUJ84_Chr003264 [Rhizobium leguminosarum]